MGRAGGARIRQMAEAEQPLHIHVRFHEVGKSGHSSGSERAGFGSEKAEVSLGDLDGLFPRDRAEHGAPARCRRVPQPRRVAGPAHPVAHDSGHPDVWIKRLEPQDCGGRRTNCGRGIHDKEDWQLEPPGDLGAAASIASPVQAVEEAHHPFDQCHVGAGGMAGEDRLDLLLREKPAVQVVGRASRHDCMQAGINEVRPDLEALDAKPPATEGSHEPQGHGRLSHAAGRAANQKTEHSAPRPEKERPIPPLTEWGSRIQQSERSSGTGRMMGRLPRGRISTPGKLSRFPGSRLGLLSAPSRSASRGTVACADFNAAHSCGAAMDSSSFPLHERDARNHHFPSEVPGPGTTQPRLFNYPRQSSSSGTHARQAPCDSRSICIRTAIGSQAISWVLGYAWPTDKQERTRHTNNEGTSM